MKKIKIPSWPVVNIDDDEKTKRFLGDLVMELNLMAQKITEPELDIVTKTASYTLTEKDDIVLCNGTFTVTLPTAGSCKRRVYYIKNIGSGEITIDGAGSETIDGETTQSISHQYKSLTIISDGSNWHII
jgi:hypothetical protein